MTRDALAVFKAEFGGPVLLPSDPSYADTRRIWNGMHLREPAVIARCTSTADVRAAVRFAVASGLPVTVRGGGHNVAGTAVADGAVMIDLSLMREVTVDRGERVAHAQGGCLLGDLDAATTPHGLACPAGVVSHTGLAGLTLGGGYGWLARKWGLTCDHLLSAEVVLADGSVVETETHPDLLWALRGGGGNFGVVTRFTLRLREVGPVHHWAGVYPLEDAGAALARYRWFAEQQSADLHAVGAMKVAGEQGWIPAALRGKPVLTLTSVWLGAPERGQAASAALFDAVRPAASVRRVMPYAELQALGDHGEPHGNRYFTKSCYLAELSADTIEGLVESCADIRSPLSAIDFEYLRGAIGDVPDGESAFPRRAAPYICTASAQWLDPGHDPENISWARATMSRLAEHAYGGAYVNYLQDEPDSRVRDVYGDDRYAKLAGIKQRYDPGNLFRENQNIPPRSNQPVPMSSK
ncbi:FAD-binding oxidoreductase [Amycolatopsis sp. NPDC059021]|uniref:FAD-binding oxidoreductase n=1 Tax=Amycolatopsis sp. NPDC059021 TaxID=3346704 RepID=UPI003672ABB1